MKKSKKFRLNWFDVLKGFLIAFISAGLTMLQQTVTSGVIDWKGVLNVSIAGGLAYLLKNLFTDEKSS